MIPSNLAGPASQSTLQSASVSSDLLAAIIAADSRGTVVFSVQGELLLANPAVGAAIVAKLHGFGRSSGWEQARSEAESVGSSEVVLDSGESGELHIIPDENGRARFCLLRLDDRPDGQTERSFVERFTDMAHDLRAPLQSLIIAADGLSDVAGSDGRAGELGSLAQLAADQVRNLLETVRMEKVAADTEPHTVFDLVAITRDMTRLLDPICRRNNNYIVSELVEGEAWQSGAPQLIRAILQNLISNANHFNMKGPITVRLRLAPTEAGSERIVTLEVEDVGPGLTEAARKVVLAPPTGRTIGSVSEGGYGLGLGIVSRAVTRLRGRLEVGPGAECGTLFRITFPLKIASAHDEQPVTPRESVSLAGLRILVVEDNPTNLAILLRTLSETGAEAEGVMNGTDALLRTRAKRGEIDVILLDVTLPDIDGIEVARQIRAEETGEDKVLIMGLTAHVGSVIHGSGLAAGMNHILIKPVRPSELCRALKDARDGIRPKPQVHKMMQSPDDMLNNALLLELTDEMGRQATLDFMQRAMTEARQLLEDVPSIEGNALRARIHSAIGSAGLTGLSGVEYVLRTLQIDARKGAIRQATLKLAHEIMRSTEQRLQQFASE